jgi:hypothetical protein
MYVSRLLIKLRLPLPEKEPMIHVPGMPCLASLPSFRTGLDERLLLYAVALGQVACPGLTVHLPNRWPPPIVGVFATANLPGGHLVLVFFEAPATDLSAFPAIGYLGIPHGRR